MYKADFKPVTQRHDKVLIVCGGESLIGFDINQFKDFDGAIITVNNVIYHLPRADYWITVDPMWQGKPQRAMIERLPNTYYYCAYPKLDEKSPEASHYQTVEGIHYLERILPSTSDYRLQEDKSKITTCDSSYGALGLAYHFEATKIIILGVDAYGYGHWYDKNDPYNKWGLKDFDRFLKGIVGVYPCCVEQLKKRGTKVVFGSPKSPIDCFEKMDPDKAFHYFD